MLSVQMSFCWTSKEIGPEYASHFLVTHTISKYFELIVNWFLNLLVRNVNEREIKREKVQMKPPLCYWQSTGRQYRPHTRPRGNHTSDWSRKTGQPVITLSWGCALTKAISCIHVASKYYMVEEVLKKLPLAKLAFRSKRHFWQQI